MVFTCAARLHVPLVYRLRFRKCQAKKLAELFSGSRVVWRGVVRGANEQQIFK